MIVAGYACTGKSELAKQYPEMTMEIPSMPYSWILPYADPNVNYEPEKATKYHVRSPLFPGNMLASILAAERKHGMVIIPTINAIVEVLQQSYGREVVLCYPEEGLEEEYRDRFIKRNNNDNFIELFADKMNLFIEPLKKNTMAHHIILKSGEYLTDHWEELERLRMLDKTLPVPLERIEALKEVLTEQSQNNALVLMPLRKRKTVACLLSDLEDDDVKNFVYNMGRKLGSALCSLLIIVNKEMLKELDEMGDLTIVDRNDFIREIEEWLAWNMGYFAIDCE